jgi:hypothetical protein
MNLSRAVTIHVVNLDEHPDDAWLSVRAIARWVQLGRSTLYRFLPESSHPLVLSRWGRESGARAADVKLWFLGRTWGKREH